MLVAKAWLLQSQENSIHKSESCSSLQTRCPAVRSAFLSPVPDVDDGFTELSDFGSSDLEVNRCVAKTNVADQEAATVLCRKRRRRQTDDTYEENLSAHTLVHVATSPTCPLGHETPTSSKQSVKRAKECMELSCSQDGERSVHSRTGARRLVRCNSEAVIRQALSTSEEQVNLVGDFSRPHSLPLLTASKHQDLKSIGPDTVSAYQPFFRILSSLFCEKKNYLNCYFYLLYGCCCHFHCTKQCRGSEQIN